MAEHRRKGGETVVMGTITVTVLQPDPAVVRRDVLALLAALRKPDPDPPAAPAAVAA